MNTISIVTSSKAKAYKAFIPIAMQALMPLTVPLIMHIMLPTLTIKTLQK